MCNEVLHRTGVFELKAESDDKSLANIKQLKHHASFEVCEL